MNNSIIFASRKQPTMSSYHIFLDDDLVATVERLMKLDGSFQKWLQDQVDSWLRFKGLPPLRPNDFPDLSDEAYSAYIKKQSGHLPKGVEQWL